MKNPNDYRDGYSPAMLRGPSFEWRGKVRGKSAKKPGKRGAK